MLNLALPEQIHETVLNFILQTHETKVQQEEFIAFAESMPPSKNTLLNGLNFKKVLHAADGMQ